MSVIQNWIGELSQSGIAERSLKVGQTRTGHFALPNVHGQITCGVQTFSRTVPLVVMFYRGEWCPFCNLAVRAYQAILPEIKVQGATLVAISPQTPDNSLSIAEKAGLEYEVLSDIGNVVARQFGIVYRLGEPIYELQKQFGVDLPKANGDDSRELPMPGTFIIDQSGVIRFAQVFADHSQRAEPSAVVDALRHLKSA